MESIEEALPSPERSPKPWELSLSMVWGPLSV